MTDEEITDELCRIREKLELNEQLFNMTDDDMLTEALIYERQALLLRFSSAFAKAKEYGMKGDGFSWLK